MVDLRLIADHLSTAFGGVGPSTLARVSPPDSDLIVDLATWADKPGAGLTSFTTIGMSAFDNRVTTPRGELRVELVTAFQERWTQGSDLLIELAFVVGRGETNITPGRVFTNVPRLRDAVVTTPHVLFWDPFLWQLPALPMAEVTVAWLAVIPITDAEQKLVAERGADALIDEFERFSPDIHDLSRPSVV
jgi:hypothetical protein